MKRRIWKSLLLMLITIASGCGNDTEHSTAQDSKSDDEVWIQCKSRFEAISCLRSLSDEKKKQLMGTFKAYDQVGEWPIELMDSSSFVRRYQITANQRKCIENTMCRRVSK